MTYYLVQRLESQNVNKPGFDRYFSLDYMGSSEFEWGAIPKALKSMRAFTVEARGIDVTIDGKTRTVYFVGRGSRLERAASDMEKWAAGDERRPKFWAKEYTAFPEAFADVPDRWRNTNAWWAIQEDIAWALDAEIAERLVTAFNSKPADVKAVTR